ncbi:hypothetical protein BD779DRAFT_405324 [Infundibulicybe gibba]|nr:hypothetical protein BD779DRAFT_405324 [Infundibulicybe gibba]
MIWLSRGAQVCAVADFSFLFLSFSFSFYSPLPPFHGSRNARWAFLVFSEGESALFSFHSRCLFPLPKSILPSRLYKYRTNPTSPTFPII